MSAYEAAAALATTSVGPPPMTAAQKRTDQEIEDLVARAEAMERMHAQKPNARDTLMAALMKQKAEKAEWARQKELAATERGDEMVPMDIITVSIQGTFPIYRDQADLL
ncbi:hypothetical protein RhiJN_27376 [Ceratobasidium sp. AG-Ba]|nr:hypothetical protein RhiJN_13294 [Ceratobasidium sp. AG-Ba]QRV99357.1 hypothetical protein RhiJN_27376 [Ceratobasidium sp. AG-Ba]QRW13861.1 hypothetical protein RhiLY_12860 [Ceratobasidium sp. AG-Ba]